MGLLAIISCHVDPLGFYLFPWALMVFTFTSRCAHGSAGCHFLPCWPIGLLPLSLGSHGPFALLLPLTTPMDLLARWAFTFFFGLLWPICFYLVSQSFPSSFSFDIGLFLLLGPCQKRVSTVFNLNKYFPFKKKKI